MGSNERGVPAATVLDNAALGGIINVDQAEALAVALGPLKVVQEGPDDLLASIAVQARPNRPVDDCENERGSLYGS